MSSGASTSDPTARALALAKTSYDRIRARVSAMSKPAKIFAASTAIACVLLFGWLGWRSSETTWSVLFTNLERDDAAAVVAKLKEMKVPYRVEGDGGTIEVPQAAARELRLELAGAGLPRGGGVGFESFDKMRLGATEFEQRVLYRRALEGELSRTIDTIASVQSTRVHLVLPERSVFVGKNEPASASVVLKLRGGRALGAQEVSGIVHLVSSSVAGLAPDRVTVVTTEGTMLHRPRKSGESEGEEDQASGARSLEATLEERARTMLEKVAGAGHVDVRVTAELDRARIERVEDRYDPKSTVVRSEQRSVERNAGEPTAAGVPGAESNLPDGAARGADAGADTVTRESSTRNFEVDHVTEKRLVTGGTVRRLTVAVVVDQTAAPGAPPRSKEDVERLAALVKSAVGADPSRGDVVTVESVPFLAVPVEAAPAAPAPLLPKRFERYLPPAIGGAAALVGLVALALLRRRKKKAAALAKPETALVARLAEPIDDARDAPAPTLAGHELRALAHERAAEDPATAAAVLRFWLGATQDMKPLADGPKSLREGITLAAP